jgi:hypothetical protein
MRGRRLVAVLLMVAGLAGCSGSEPGVYPLAVHDVFQKLAENKLDDFKMKRQCGILIHFRPESIVDKSVTWRVYSSGRELLSFTANLTPVGQDKTKVDVEVSNDPDGTDAYAGGDFYPRPALLQPLKPAVAEAIAAELEGRAFDPQRVPKPAERDRVCQIQKARLQSSGKPFSVDDNLSE